MCCVMSTFEAFEAYVAGKIELNHHFSEYAKLWETKALELLFETLNPSSNFHTQFQVFFIAKICTNISIQCLKWNIII